MKKYLLSIVFFLYANLSIAQNCIINSTDSASLSYIQTTSQCLVQVCVSVPNSPSPKRIEYYLTTPAGIPGVALCANNTTVGINTSCGGGNTTQFAAGTYCHTFSLVGQCPSLVTSNVIGFTNATGGAGGDCQTLSYSANPLPISLKSFYGKTIANAALLYWELENEQDIESYEVQKSTNGSVFTTVGSLKASQTTQLAKYSFVDENLRQNAYYRIVVHTINGGSETSKTILLFANKQDNNNIIVYPSITSSYLNLFNPYTELPYSIINIQGQLIYSKRIAHEGVNKVDVSWLNKGTYLIYFGGQGSGVVKRFTVGVE